MHADQPSSTADIKLILGGKFLDNGEILNGALFCDSRMLWEGSLLAVAVQCTGNVWGMG